MNSKIEKPANKKILIGGQAMLLIGSTRATEDTGFLIYEETSKELFTRDKVANVDYINAAASPFYRKIWEAETQEQASANSLFKMKIYAYVQHIQKAYWDKADATMQDIVFLTTNFKVDFSILEDYLNPSELKEVKKEIIEEVEKLDKWILKNEFRFQVSVAR